MDIFTKVNHMGTTVVMVTHDQQLVDMMNKRVIEIVDGKIVRDEQQGGYDIEMGTMRYYLSEAFTSFWRNSFMSIASIATVAVSFFILGLFLIMVANLDYFADNLENQVQISVYLKDDLTTDQVMSVGSRLKALPDVKELEFTNKDQAMDKLKERMKDQPGILDAFDGKNPLPTSYTLTLSNPEQVKKTAAVVGEYDEVESTHYGQEIVEQLFRGARYHPLGWHCPHYFPDFCDAVHYF